MRYIHRHDVKTVLSYSGQMMIMVGIMCLIPIIIDLIYLEFNLNGYLIAGFFSIALGLIFDKGFSKNKKQMKLKHAMILSSFIWLWASLIGGIAVSLITNLDYISSVFENMSALTGTGISMFMDVEILPYSILFFRSFEQWIGGLGVIVLVIGIMTRPGTASSKLYQSEAREERLKPSIKTTLKKTFKIYVIYTIIGIILYLLAGMHIFDAINATFTSISTGGMSIKNENIGYYHSTTIYIITIILMILGATSFTTHYKIIKSHGKSLIKDIQFQIMIIIIAVGIILIGLTSNLIPINVLFTVTSAITTTGASVEPSIIFNNWPVFCLIVILTFMLIGGSSSSTSGSIKIVRIIIFFKGVYKHLKEIMSPEGRVIPIKLSNHILSEKEVAESGTYITLFLVFILIGWGIFCAFGYDPFKSLFGIISIQGNNGLDLGIVDYHLHWFLKLVSIFNMWIGRLEIYPVLVLVKTFFEILKR